MKNLVVIRGAGDLASGIIHKLHKSGFHVIALESSKPTSIRRKVSFSEAVYDGNTVIEGVQAKLCNNIDEINDTLKKNQVSIVIDEKADLIKELKPLVLIDSILAKKNIGTSKDMADIVIGIGPGFNAGKDCNVVIETKRGHDLGRIIYKGSAYADTGIPGNIGGYSIERVFHSPSEGNIINEVEIGEIVQKDQHIFTVNNYKVTAPFPGVIRGIIRNNSYVQKGMKVADIDPRLDEVKNCYTISEKARCIAGGVLEAILELRGDLYEQ